ncbi:inositol monophosphatase family protein [Mycobacterium sp. MBM]|nr:inositol monophosphatase family protein [Mycobacterium sp. MBM]
MTDAQWLTGLLASLHSLLDKVDGMFLDSVARAPRWHDKSDRDPVSETDVAIETWLREQLSSLTPDVPFVGEETGGGVPKTGLAWVVDPVDGTVNFLERLPLCGTSIGLVQDNIPVLGAVSLPLLGSRFGGGPRVPATENGRRMAVSTESRLRRAIVAVGDYSTGPGAQRKNDTKLELHRRLAAEVYRVRMLGSAAIDLVWLASGRLHGSVTMSNNSWDMCGGVAIALGAGACVTDANGEPYTLESRTTLAAAPNVWEALRDTVRPVL